MLKPTKRWALILIAVLILGITGCGTVKDNAKKATLDKVIVNTQSKTQKLPNFTINLKIPVIDGMSNTAQQKEINQIISQDQIKRIKPMKEELANYVQFAKENDYPVNPFDLVSDYKVSYNKNDLLSVTATIYQYTGGAHGTTEQVSYNVDLQTGQLLTLKDLFKTNTNYINPINQEIEKQIAAKPEEFFTEDNMGFKTIQAKQPFYLTDGGIVVYFQLYEIAPYAAGIKEFKIPVALINTQLNKRFVP
ncbi:MAG: DUF3298 and DUF4163 domain-containing protein [Ignavibacteriales bacterium]